MSISNDIFYVGVNDYDLDLFEGQYPIPNGMAYNSYAVVDEKIAVIDSVEVRFAAEWIGSIRSVLQAAALTFWWCSTWNRTTPAAFCAFSMPFPTRC